MTQYLCTQAKLIITSDFQGCLALWNPLSQKWNSWRFRLSKSHFGCIQRLQCVCTWTDFGHEHLKIFSLLAKGGGVKIYVGEGKPGRNQRVLIIPIPIKVGTPRWRETAILSTYTAFAQNVGRVQIILSILQRTAIHPEKSILQRDSPFNA